MLGSHTLCSDLPASVHRSSRKTCQCLSSRSPLSASADTTMASLYNLTPELLVSILQQVSCLRDLRAIISTASLFRGIFNSHQTSILKALLVNSIHSVALHHALAVCYAPSPPIIPPPPDTRHHHEHAEPPECLKSFLNRYFSGNTFELPSEISSLRLLCRLRARVSRFSNEYFVHATSFLQGAPINGSSVGSATPSTMEPLFTTERARLERALFGAMSFIAGYSLSIMALGPTRYFLARTSLTSFSPGSSPWRPRKWPV